MTLKRHRNEKEAEKNRDFLILPDAEPISAPELTFLA